MAKQFDVIEHQIIGDDMQAVVITLDSGEQVIAEAGAMLYMNAGIEMQTTMGGGATGLMGNVLKAAGRVLTGESFFITTFTNVGQRKSSVAFAAPYPGKIVPLDLALHGGQVICQKDAFLCAARGTDITVAFQKNLGTGLFGGEGFILQRLSGGGMAFAHAGGTVFMKQLGAGDTVRVDTGCIVGFEATVQYNIQFVGGFKNALFGGEGLFLATLTGPGRAYLQTLPFSRLADRIISASRRMGGRSKDEGSLLGGMLLGR
jgi:uncharacterized protein (TIGR00266 family)